MDKILLIAPKGANRKKRIVGRGIGSGRGSTSGRGSKGQGSRSGGSKYPGFEGGQMPLYRRIARRGFSNYPFKKLFEVINVSDLEVFENGSAVAKEDMLKKGILKKRLLPVKLLGNGDITKKLTVSVDKASQSAKDKISAAGGAVVEIAADKIEAATKVKEARKEERAKKKAKKTEKPVKADKKQGGEE
jgi:large subunit ribosomal protein L15